MTFIDLPNDIRVYFIKFFDIYMLRNYALTYKYGLESIQKYLFYRRLMNEKNKIKPTIHNSFIRVQEKYLKDEDKITKRHYVSSRILSKKNGTFPIIKINKIKDCTYQTIEKYYKCYFLVISNPELCGNKYYMYPNWHVFNTIDFDKDDYIPFI